MATSGSTLNDPLGSDATMSSGLGGGMGSAMAPELDSGAMGGSGSKSMTGGAGGIKGAIDKQAGSIREQATTRLRSFADEGKQQVTSTLDGLVTAAREIATKLQDGQFGPVGGYATQAAETLEGWTESVRNKSVDDLFDDGKELARRSPVLVAGIAVAAGFAISRILKAGNGTQYRSGSQYSGTRY